eukprot:2330175-Amphidinium_carterae.1
MTSDLKTFTNRESGWYSRKDLDRQFQIKGENAGRESSWKTIIVGKYMEMKAAYRQRHTRLIGNKKEYKQNRLHDYSVIATNIDLDEEYVKKHIIKIYQQAEKPGRRGDEVQPAHKHRLMLFLTQHYLHKVPYLLHNAGATQEQCNLVLQNFDDDASKHFTKVNARPLSSLQTPFQRAAALERIRPEPAQ